MSDPIAPHSAPISAYMSVHEATNVAYVRHFAGIDNVATATFESINSQGFQVSYTLKDGMTDRAYIAFKTPLTKREDIRPVLEEMAKEAETALGLPSSLVGPPPVAAIAKALYAQGTSVYTPPEPRVPLNIFYPVSRNDALSCALLFGSLAVFGYASDRQLPGFLHPVRSSLLKVDSAKRILKGLAYVHTAEAVLALAICLRRGWYSTENTIKWTLSTLVFGVFSTSRLIKHGRDV
ncbi:hypothetical protein DM01DRAFT_1337203 [Hesseltinella vesiculosa]|uniref:DUF2470 domain-containing protein n=1 Tax=Hesseltinella vesiculosa TaxID=101127 RepID=A0A1X2GEA1_9FUNG|nr:hypothetical protein DM01DRAFT_1337203 [Hesseltinella vesiculosa]